MRRRTSVIDPCECAICGEKLYRSLILQNRNKKGIETIVTKRNTVVRFHTECYKQLLERQKEKV
jgi:hypothetical protein